MAVTIDAAVRVTTILATLAWATGEALILRSPRRLVGSGELDRASRSPWHMSAWPSISYGWNHEAPSRRPASSAATRVGWGWRADDLRELPLLVLWLADVCWWWAAPASHASMIVPGSSARRVRLAGFPVHVRSAAIVFASGPSRWVGIASVEPPVSGGSSRGGETGKSGMSEPEI